MMGTYTIGKIDGKPVKVDYSRVGQSSLPEIIIRYPDGRRESYRGSSLGPCNAECYPNETDVAVWQALAKLSHDPAQAKRSIAAHRGVRTRDHV